MKTYTSQDVIKKAAELLRIVAEGGNTDSLYFWSVTLATEGLRDGDVIATNMYMRQAEATQGAEVGI
jgi:hypothetical protein